MKVDLKLDDVPATLGNNGIVLEIRDGQDNHIGNLRIGRATVEWTKSRARKPTWTTSLEDLIDYMNSAG